MNTKPYLDDLTEEEWSRLGPILKEGVYRQAGRQVKYLQRGMLNTFFYILRTVFGGEIFLTIFLHGQLFIRNL